MENVIIIAVLISVIFLSAFYIYKAKKNGKKCIGCPYACSCEKKSNTACNCTSCDK